MSKLQRVRNVLAALLMILCSLLLIAYPVEGYQIVALILSLSLLLAGGRALLYYFTMARHMVGGRSILYQGIIILDLGALTYSVSDVPRVYLIFYLLGFHAFTGIISLLRALELRKLAVPMWRFTMGYGIARMVIAALAVICGLAFQSPRIVVDIYCFGLVYAACVRLSAAFRRTAVVYIP